MSHLGAIIEITDKVQPGESGKVLRRLRHSLLGCSSSGGVIDQSIICH